MKFTFSIIFCLAAMAIFAQPKQNSPYSRYGLGDAFPKYYAQHGAMGGLTVANHDVYHLNFVNPAAFAHLRSTAFETGLYAKNSNYKSTTAESSAWSGNLTHFSLGFPLRSPINEALDRVQSNWKFGAGAGFAPVNLIGYNVRVVDTLPGLDEVTSDFVGRGGIYQMSVGGGAKYKNTAFGAQLGWNFGKANYENTTSMRDTSTTQSIHFQDNFLDDATMNGFSLSLGAMHDFNLKFDPNNKKLATEWLTLGATFATPYKLTGTANSLKIRSRGQLINSQFEKADTLVRSQGQSLEIEVPGSVTLGLMYTKANKRKIGIQIEYAGWEKYSNNLRPFKMRNTLSISAGAEFIPDIISYNNYAKRIRYRVGGYFRQDPRIIGGENVNDLGVTFGFGLPLILPRQGTSFINSAFEIGQLGGGTAVSETYFRITFGFTLNDNSWFYKRRFE